MNDIEDGEVVVMLREKVKRGGELMATYRMEYPDLATALRALADDLKAGRVESMQVGGRLLADEDMAALAKSRGGKGDGSYRCASL